MKLRTPQLLTLLALCLLSGPAYAQPTADDATEPTPPLAEDALAEDAVTENTTVLVPDDDLQSLRAEYFKLRDRLFQSRARSSAVSSALYSTRLSVGLKYDSGRFYTVTRATIRLDGANIYDDTEGQISEDQATRFEGFIAPGRHMLSIRIEATGKDDQRFTSVQENSFVIQAIKDKDLRIRAVAKDSGDLAYKWKKKEAGSYKLQLNVSVKSVKRGTHKQQHLKRTGKLRKHGPGKALRS